MTIRLDQIGHAAPGSAERGDISVALGDSDATDEREHTKGDVLCDEAPPEARGVGVRCSVEASDGAASSTETDIGRVLLLGGSTSDRRPSVFDSMEGMH